MTRDELPIKVWLWRAWAKDRSRICDCGTVRATELGTARGIAWATLAGPWRHAVTEMQLEEITL